jgi:NRAMP (natural resistance-associated macrophage protein)-like metal ion transporter
VPGTSPPLIHLMGGLIGCSLDAITASMPPALRTLLTRTDFRVCSVLNSQELIVRAKTRVRDSSCKYCSPIGTFSAAVSQELDEHPRFRGSVPTQMTARKNPPTKNVEDGKGKSLLGRTLGVLGPGLITGAADDDPSGISTYSVAGAAYGYATLWIALLTFPLMTAVQLMCARLGVVTGRGLAAAVRIYYPRWVLWGACSILAVANVINIGADLGGMAEATQLVTGIRSLIWILFYAFFITGLLIWISYKLIARIFRWLTLVLFAYVFTSFFAHVDWRHALAVTFVPHLEWSRGFLAVLVAILGTTISPYLFFWQAAEEVEEGRSKGRTLAKHKGTTAGELRRVRADTVAGMFFSNGIMYFIILTTAATLHAHGETDVTTARQAAEALRPLAGNGAYLLFTLGLIGTGMLGVPVLVGSCAYAVAEGASWRGSMAEKPRSARKFYAVMVVAMAMGLGLNYLGFSAVKMLFWSAIINGLLAPPLILLVILLTSSHKVMGERVNSPLLRYLGWATFAVMTAAAVGMLITS